MTEYEAPLARSLSPTPRAAMWGKESRSGPCDLQQSLDELSLSGAEPPHPSCGPSITAVGSLRSPRKTLHLLTGSVCCFTWEHLGGGKKGEKKVPLSLSFLGRGAGFSLMQCSG